MNKSLNIIKERERKFERKWSSCNCEGGFDIGQCDEENDYPQGHKYSEDAIKSFNTQTLKLFLEAEIERLEGEKKNFMKEVCMWRDCKEAVVKTRHQVDAHNKCIEKEISHYKTLLSELKE